MSTEANFRQEMPPVGGYQKFVYSRNPAKTLFNGWTLFAGYIGMTAGALYLYSLNLRKVTRTEREMNGASLAIYPMLLAERDREYLKQLRRNREEERDLMKNVEGWKVGTFYGEPLFRTTKKDDPMFEPMISEYYVHARFKDYERRAHMPLYC